MNRQMQHHSLRRAAVSRTLVAALTGCLVIVPYLSVAQDTTEAKIRFEKGLEHLDAGRYERAVVSFESVRQTAEDVGDSAWVAECLFYVGLAGQLKAQVSGDSMAALLGEAIGVYERALEYRPDFPEALNNLGKAYAALGDEKEALESYRKATRYDDGLQTVYAANLAQALVESGEWEDGASIMSKQVLANPDLAERNRKLVSLHIEKDPAGLLPLLWDLIDSSRESAALDMALHALEEGRHRLRRDREGPPNIDETSLPQVWDDHQKRELMTIAAMGLAGSHVGPQRFRGGVGERLSQLLYDPVLKSPVDELFYLYEAERETSFTTDDFGWWTDYAYFDSHPNAKQPMTALRMLATSLGEWYHNWNQLKKAREYYELAIDLSDIPEKNPRLLTQMSDVYFTLRDAKALEQLVERYQPDLFQMKKRAYELSDVKGIYTYHRALGLMFSNLEELSGEHRTGVASAEFQLFHAIDKAREFNHHADRTQSPERLEVEVQLVKRLADIYERTDQRQRAKNLLREMREDYVKWDRKAAADSMLLLRDSL